MSERLTRYERSRWGRESTHGTSPTTLFQQMTSISAMLGVEAEYEEFTAAGMLMPSILSIDKEISTLEVTGRLSYSGVNFPLLATLGDAISITRNIPTTGLSYLWLWSPGLVTEIDPVSYTIEQGQAAYAERAAYCTLSEFGFTWGRGPIEVNGKGFGRALQKGITLTTAGLADVPAKPAFGRDVSIYLDDSAAAYGTTQLLRAISGSWKFGTGRLPSFYANRLSSDWAHTADGDPVREVSLVMQADSTGMALLDNMRTGATKYLRIGMIGDLIETGYNYSLTVDSAVKVIAAPSRSDQDRVYGVEWKLGIMHDVAGSFQVRLQNIASG